eukprot:COSAG04_NODE_22508_length_353_cov_1.496063_2_plen_39_part_01
MLAKGSTSCAPPPRGVVHVGGGLMAGALFSLAGKRAVVT